MTYYLAPSLVQLRNEVNSRWPKRSKISDGWIGDAAHNARKSDHNPDYSSGGVVRALDITKAGINVSLLLKHTTNDARVAYVIYNHRIYQHSTGWQPYNGPNPHTQHVHVSIAHTRTAETRKNAWFGSASSGGSSGSSGSSSKPAGRKPTRKDPNRYTVRSEAAIRRILIRITKGTSKNSTPHLIGLYQRQQRSPFKLKHDQIFGRATDNHFRWVGQLQKHMNKWKGTKLAVDGSYGRKTHNRVRDLQRRNKGGRYKGIIDGFAGPVFCKMLGIKKYPN